MDFVTGMIAMGFLTGAMFFFRFWARSRDALFLWFAAAFTVLFASQALIVATGVPREEQTVTYLLRLLAFCLILVAILIKNLRRRDDRG
ncbi:MAG TPA: DUF5985 family protein [Beijerinckiaceae bacterium]